MELMKFHTYGQEGERPLWEAVEGQLREKRHRFHVPAHRAVPGEYWPRFDLTELPGLDQLFAPDGAIARAQELAAALFQADRTYFLVNGSSAGVIASVAALCRPGEVILVPRNCHRSVAAGLIFSGARPCFLPVPESPLGFPLNVAVSQARSALAGSKPGPKAMVVTSPSYWGVCARLADLAAESAGAGCALLVDEAHGGHFLFHPELPAPAAGSGADLWVNSAHKTLGALTPGAYLHLKERGRVDRERLEAMLPLVQTSSPPYPVLLSLDLVREALQRRGRQVFEEALEKAARIRRQLRELRRFRCLEADQLPEEFGLDPLRLTIYWNDLDLAGEEVQFLLHKEYRIEVEMAGGKGYLVAVVHPGLPAEAGEALVAALKDLEQRYRHLAPGSPPAPYPLPRLLMTPREAVQSPSRPVPLREAAGEISARLVAPLPPGIPLLYPGEEISPEMVRRLMAELEKGARYQGLTASSQPEIHVIAL